MDTIVDYKTAVLLKEKGFDEPTQKAYINGKLFVNFEESENEKEFYFDADNFYEYWNRQGWIFTERGSGCFGCKLDNIKYFEAYSAPIIAEVVMWLYKKHEIWIIAEPFIKQGWETLTYIYKIYKNGYVDTISRTFLSYNSPTEACVAAINYTLNKLI